MSSFLTCMYMLCNLYMISNACSYLMTLPTRIMRMLVFTLPFHVFDVQLIFTLMTFVIMCPTFVKD